MGRAAPDPEEDEEASEVSAQDRQRFMQSLHSPEKGGPKTKNFTKGFERMRAKAKDMYLQAKSTGANAAGSGAAAQAPHAPEGSREGASAQTDAELGRGGRLARDMTMMFAGLKKQAKQ